jgi:uroporphyrinogen III methyltransferase/synthase
MLIKSIDIMARVVDSAGTTVTVYLVGAGPGDPGLLTLKGRDLLGGADAVLYDGLVDARVLALARPGATLVDVAKTRPGGHATGYGAAQRAINDLLVAYGRALGCVVRLKGGDPFVFGRGGEEALALAEAGIPFEVVPGVSAAVAVPAYAGIPVTHRGLASSVAVVTGHESPDKPAGTGVDWARLATGADTLIVLMGVTRLPAVVARLLAHGRPAETPAAVVEQGTVPAQRVVVGTLAALPRLAAEAGLRSPAVIVVGEVVRLRQHLAWFAPLAGAGLPEAAAATRVAAESEATGAERERAEVPACG